MSTPIDLERSEEEVEERGWLAGILSSYKTQILAVLSVIVFGLVALAIFHLTQEVRYDDVVLALTDTKVSSILLALFFTGLSFFALVFYDQNALEFIGKKLPFAHVALTAFSAYAVGNTAGFGALSAGAIRYRAYTRQGLTPEEITRVIAFVTLSFGLGL
jgi:phosphatidylglycerol lysyltransferase